MISNDLLVIETQYYIDALTYTVVASVVGGQRQVILSWPLGKLDNYDEAHETTAMALSALEGRLDCLEGKRRPGGFVFVSMKGSTDGRTYPRRDSSPVLG